MNQAVAPVFLYLTAFVLGLRHGIDWDHIAAITDIAGSSQHQKSAFAHGMVYALGHAFVIVLFGLLAIALGIRLPSWVDAVMEPFVGLTLVILGIWVIFSLIKHRENFRLQSRWMLLIKSANALYRKLHNKLSHYHPRKQREPIPYPDTFGFKTAFTVGMIHGIGAETPTQILIFLAAAKIGGGLMGTYLLITFVTGLLISNAFITTIASFGYAKSEKNSFLYIGLGIITAAFSLIVGLFLLTGHITTLPKIFGN